MTDQIPSSGGARLPPAGQPDKANGTKTISVGCKLPNGLICEMGKVGDSNHTVVRLNGSNDATVVGGFGITEHVSEEFWNAWIKKHRGMAFVKRGLVFAMDDADSARDHAVDQATTRSGFEALNPMEGVKDKDGKPLITPDVNHLAQGRRDIVQTMERARNAG